MLTYLKTLIFPDIKLAIILTTILKMLICVGTLTPLIEQIDASGSDKWHHFIAFAALVYPLTFASRSYWMPASIFGLSLGASIEFIQPYVNRFGDIKDLQADMLGVSVGLLVGFLVRKIKPN